MTKHHTDGVKIIALVGLAGSGKSTAVDYLTEKGYPKVYFGGVIYKAMDEAGLEVTWENQQAFREEIRQKEGKDFVVKRIIEELHDLIGAGQKNIIADGLYTWTEYKALKRAFPGELTTIAILTPKRLRHHRLTLRTERPLTLEEANTRDYAEIENLEKGGPIAMADYFIINDHDEVSLHHQIDTICHEVMFY